jgi:hypothetical protein
MLIQQLFCRLVGNESERREKETTEVKQGESANIDETPVTLLYHIPDVTGSIGNSVGITHKYR